MALESRRVVLEAFLLANADGPIDQAKNASLGKVVFAFPLEPDEFREIAAEARLIAREMPPRTTEAFSERVIYQRACELAWEDGEIEGDRRQLDTLRHGLGLDEKVAEALLGEARDAPPKPAPPKVTPSGRTVAPPPADPGPPPEALSPQGPTRYFRWSGRASPASLAVTCIAGLIVALVGGLGYGPLLWCMPMLILGMCLPALLGWAVGWVIGRIAALTKVRSLLAVTLIAIVSGAVADYAGFISWLFALTDGKLLVFSPQTLYAVLCRVAEKGVWGIDKGTTVSGSALWFVWLCELLLMVGMSVHFALKGYDDVAYCEPCGRWYDGPLVRYVEARSDTGTLMTHLDAGDLRVLHGLRDVKANCDENLRLALIRCGKCSGQAYLSVLRRSRTVVNGRSQWKEKRVTDRLAVTADAGACLFGGR